MDEDRHRKNAALSHSDGGPLKRVRYPGGLQSEGLTLRSGSVFVKGRSLVQSQISDPQALVESSAVTAQSQAVSSERESAKTKHIESVTSLTSGTEDHAWRHHRILCSSAPELSLGRRSSSGPLTPRGKSKSTQNWKPTNNKVAQTLVTASSEIAPTAESKLSSFVESFSERTPNEQAAIVSLFPARIVESDSPVDNATIRNVSCRMLMDTGGQVSVLPFSLCQKLKPPVNLPVPTREVATYGSNTVLFHGPVLLHVQLCGLTILHPFYIVDGSKAGLAPAIGGYDLMK